MKILFCSRNPLSKELGASKVLIELTEEMEQLGWQCTLLSPKDIEPSLNGTPDYSVHLRRYLIEHAREYDVVEYDHGHLPYPRNDFPSETLFVARSVLLGHHFNKISIPRDRSIKGRARSLLFERSEEAQRRFRTERARSTVKEADLINVANLDDRAELIKSGVPPERVVVIPYGLSRARRAQFDSLSYRVPAQPVVVFIGTFDNRKGATDFPRIVSEISKAAPGVRFRLLGTFKDQKEVKKNFPLRLRTRIEVVPQFDADALPEMLNGCSVGIFPSYVEGFGLGVLEMLAASIPVVAYNSPGPPAMLASNYLVAAGDWFALSAAVINLLREPEKLATARRWARERSQHFSWSVIAARTSEAYLKHLSQLRTGITLHDSENSSPSAPTVTVMSER